jgi:preprotein translocase subunit SecA
LQTDVLTQFGVKIDPKPFAEMRREEIEDAIYDQCVAKYNEKEAMLGPDGAAILRETERMIMLNVIDNQWKDNLLSMDHLKEGIGLRGYGQKDPLIEYKKESFTMFQDMMDRIEDETIRFLFFMQPYEGNRPDLPYPELLDEEEEADLLSPGGDGGQNGVNGSNGTTADQKAAQGTFQDFTRNIQRKKDKELAALQFVGGDGSSTVKEPVITGAKVGRNDPCPCGSGKKYKKCCGATS